MFNEINKYSDKELILKCGEKLKHLRLEANYSQTDLANKTGMSRSSIAEIEKGRGKENESLLSLRRP